MSRRLLSGTPRRCPRWCKHVTTVTSYCTISEKKIPFHESHKDHTMRAQTPCYTFHHVCLGTSTMVLESHHAITMGEMRGVYRVLVGKPGGKRPLWRPWYGWESIKLDLLKVGWGGNGLDQADSGWGQVADTCECGNEPSGSIKCGEFLDKLQTG
jgi:hypothetical protein